MNSVWEYRVDHFYVDKNMYLFAVYCFQLFLYSLFSPFHFGGIRLWFMAHKPRKLNKNKLVIAQVLFLNSRWHEQSQTYNTSNTLISTSSMH